MNIPLTVIADDQLSNRRDRLLKIVSEFRVGILDGRSSKDMCYMVCVPLVSLLILDGFGCELEEGEVNGEHHWYIRLANGWIIDPTADQFEFNGKPLPPVMVGNSAMHRKLNRTPRIL